MEDALNNATAQRLMPHLSVQRNTTWERLHFPASPSGETNVTPGFKLAARSSFKKTWLKFCPTDDNGRTQWFLLVQLPTDIRVNGRLATTGLVALQERDEISTGQGVAFFSSEQLPQLSTYRGEEAIHCPRCRLKITKESTVLVCPDCDSIYHQAGDFECWSYGPCVMCKRDTNLENASYRWTPNEL
ncbi:MAG: hypothetical protein JKY67_18570 [Pseudomonadales bacterium]|nr:hypothetical protein [Pseudomonadales bacterium]